MLKGFKDFISRGNVVELAVGVIIGAAFKNIVDALVDGIINPLIAAVIGKPDFSVRRRRRCSGTRPARL